MQATPHPDAIIEIGTKRSRLILTLMATIALAFLCQVFLYRINPTDQRGPYFGPAVRAGMRTDVARLEAPDPMTQLFWLSAPDAVRRLWLWQFLTHGFVHSAASLWHMLVGLLGLWVFGPEVEDALGRRKLLALYFAASALCGIVSVAISPAFATMGCLASALALAGAFLSIYPDATVYFAFVPVSARRLVLAYGLLATLVCVAYLPDAFGVVCWAHLLGLPLGWGFGRVQPHLDWHVMLWQLRRHERLAAREKTLRARVDELLAKVSQLGMGSLTRSERTFLRDASRKFRHWQATDAIRDTEREPDD